MARWLEQLVEYDFDVIHRPGRVHSNADALSRKHCLQCGITVGDSTRALVTAIEAASPARPAIVDAKTWLEAQSTDPTLSVVRSWLAVDRWPRHCPPRPEADLRSLWAAGEGAFHLDGDGLLRRRRNGRGHAEDQIVVPKALRIDVLETMHNSTFGGHFASRRTLDRLQCCYFWPGMALAADAWCKGCHTCAARNEPRERRKPPYRQLK